MIQREVKEANGLPADGLGDDDAETELNSQLDFLSKLLWRK